MIEKAAVWINITQNVLWSLFSGNNGFKFSQCIYILYSCIQDAFSI